MRTLSDTYQALIQAVKAMPESLKTRAILLDRLAALDQAVTQELNAPRIDTLTALLTLAWYAAVRAESGTDCETVAIMWMHERRHTAPAQVVHFYASMLEHGYTPIVYPPRKTWAPLPAPNVSKRIQAATSKAGESLQYVPREYRPGIIEALTVHLQNVEIHLTTLTGVTAIGLHQAMQQIDTAAETMAATPPPTTQQPQTVTP